MMKSFKIGAAIGIMIGVLAAAPAYAWDRSKVDVLTVLPDVTPGVQSSVEGLTVGPDGNIYVPTFGFNTTGAADRQRRAVRDRSEWRSDQEGHHRELEPTYARARLQSAVTDNLLVLDFGAGKVLNVNPVTGSSSVFMVAPTINAEGPGLNALTFDQAGNVYVSDSFKTSYGRPAPTAVSQRNGSTIRCSRRERVLRHPSAPTASSSIMSTRSCSWPTPRFIRSSRFRSNSDGNPGTPSTLHHRHQRAGRDHGRSQ